MKRRIIRNVGWLALERLLRGLTGILVTAWVARYLGPGQFGDLSYAIAIAVFFVFLPDLGLSQVLVRELSKDDKRASSLLGTAFCLKLVGGLAAAIVLLLVALFVLPEDQSNRGWMAVVIASGFILSGFDVIDYFYQSRILSKYVVIARSLAFLLASLAKIGLILYGASVMWFAAAVFVEVLLAAVFLSVAYLSFGQTFRSWKWNSRLAMGLLSQSWPLMLSALLIKVHLRVDQVMLGQMLDSGAVGIYSVAANLAEFWYIIPVMIVGTLNPYFVALRETSHAAYLAQLNRLYSAMFWMGATISVLTIVFGEPLLVLVFGDAYLGSYQALVFNIWTGVFVGQAMARGIWLVAENLQKYRLYNNIVAVFVNVTGNLILIPRLGIAGAAATTLITQLAATWVFPLILKPLRNSTLNLIRSVNPVLLLRPANGHES